MNHEEIETKTGLVFVVSVTGEEYAEPPWDNTDCHGEVSKWTTRSKYPGELVLHEDNIQKLYYDFKGAMQRAKKEGWGIAKEGQTAGQRAYEAVMQDYNYLRDYCRGEWWYSCVSVYLEDELDKYGDYKYRDDLCGVENGWTTEYKEHFEDTVQMMVDELEIKVLRDRGELWRLQWVEIVEGEEQSEMQEAQVGTADSKEALSKSGQ